MGEIMKSNREEKTSTLNQGRPPHSEASPQQRLLLPTIQASGRRSPPPGKSFPETGSPGPPARERFPFRLVHTARIPRFLDVVRCYRTLSNEIQTHWLIRVFLSLPAGINEAVSDPMGPSRGT